MKRFLFVTVGLFILMIGFLGLSFGNALTQEGNPIPILISIAKLETSGHDFEMFSSNDNSYRYVSENKSSDVVKKFMSEKGWVFKEQMGSGFVFEKDQKVTTVGTRLFSKNYFLWDVPIEIFY
ncbi:hypothetical protein [Chengkuizengella sediminis]|uniref:hypothetical protein n=1 Tax=Chengkuizengella sediminis TaxID=1885917 RepID=UPI001F0FD7C1|nr:hypothetical protein [Chengkuizengella sediminis]